MSATAAVEGQVRLVEVEPTAAVDPALRARLWQQFRDLAAQGTTLFIAGSFVMINLLTDVIYGLVDPRIRRQ